MWKPALACGVLALALSGSLFWQGSALVVDPEFQLEQIPARGTIGSVDGLCLCDGWLYLADEGSGAVRRVDLNGEVQSLGSGGEFRSPEDLVVDDEGIVYFTDDDAGGLWRLRPGEQAQRIDEPAAGLRETEGLAITDNGDLLVGDAAARRIVRLDRDGRLLNAFALEGIAKPESIAAAADGTIFVADDAGGRIVRRRPDGTVSVLLDARDGLQEPETICLAGDAIHVVDNKAGRVVIWRENQPLHVVAQFGGKLRNIQGIAVATGGDIYLSVQSDLKRNEGCLLRLHRTPGNSPF